MAGAFDDQDYRKDSPSTIPGVALEIISARAKLYAKAMPSRASIEYVRTHGLDTEAIAEAAGCFTIMRIAVFPGGRWDFLTDGAEEEIVVAAVIEVFARDGETVADLLAWPIDEPSRVLTMFGRTDILGIAHVYAATTYTFGAPLVVHRTPLAWWQGGCRGAVVIDPRFAARHLQDAPGRIAGEDRRHTLELAGMVRALFDARKFVTPTVVPMREAA